MLDKPLHRFRLDKNLVTVNNRTQFTSGLVDMSGVYGFPALVGFPHFLHGQESLVNNLGLPVADPEKHGSFVSDRLIVLHLGGTFPCMPIASKFCGTSA